MQSPSPPAAKARRAASTGVLARALAGSALVVALLAPVALPAQSARIAYVDMKRLLDNAPQVQAGREALQREFAQRDSELKAQEARLAGLEDRQRREGALLPKAEADARQAEIDTLRRSIERMRTRLRDELSTRGDAEVKQRWGEIHDVVVEFAREQRYDLVVQSPVIYFSATIDITDQVLERLRSKAASPP
jgi:outer membrane protein